MPTKMKKVKSPTRTAPTRKAAAASSSQKSTSSAAQKKKQPPKLAAASQKPLKLAAAGLAPSTITTNNKKPAAHALFKIKQEDVTTTEAAQQQASIDHDTTPNAAANNHSGIDEVLSESDQLLRAAAEAQALGRLRNASTYLLLAHARLVGLGRRFDRSRIVGSSASTTATDGTNEDGEDSKLSASAGGILKGGKNTNNGAMDPLIQGGDQSNMSLPLAVGSNSNPSTTNNKSNTKNNSEPMLFPHQTLHHMPDGVAYVEQLARAAMELHHKRTGRGLQHDAVVEKQNAANKVKQVEQEQIRLAARGLFATAKGFTGVSVGHNHAALGGGEQASNAPAAALPPTTRKRKLTETTLDNEEKNAMAKRKGGRGKKPPTLVMHTVAGKTLDVHDLMKGSLLN